MSFLLITAILLLQEPDKVVETDLIYTTREFYFDVNSGCPMEGLCLNDFSMILTFDVGVTVQDEIKEINFKEADMEFSVRNNINQKFQSLAFKKYDHTFDSQGNKVSLTFYPDRKEGTPVPPVVKCTFEGFVRSKGGAAGKFTFFLKSGATYTVQFT